MLIRALTGVLMIIQVKIVQNLTTKINVASSAII